LEIFLPDSWKLAATNGQKIYLANEDAFDDPIDSVLSLLPPKNVEKDCISVVLLSSEISKRG